MEFSRIKKYTRKEGMAWGGGEAWELVFALSTANSITLSKFLVLLGLLWGGSMGSGQMHQSDQGSHLSHSLTTCVASAPLSLCVPCHLVYVNIEETTLPKTRKPYLLLIRPGP